MMVPSFSTRSPLYIDHNLDRAFVLQVMQLVGFQHVLELKRMRDHAADIDGAAVDVGQRRSFRCEQFVLVLCHAD